MNLSPTFLIYRTGFAPTNGTSVQLQRLFGDSGDSLVHLMWDKNEAGEKSVPLVVNTDHRITWKYPFKTLGKICKHLRALVIPPWWRWGKLNSARLAKALSAFPIRPRQAFISSYGEYDAPRAFSLWDAVGRPPFVLYIVDILEPELSEKRTPKFIRLVREASHVLCLNQLIAGQMERIGAVATSLFPLCSDWEPSSRTATAGPLKIVISGALRTDWLTENHAMQLLVEVWPKLARAFPGAELHYSGATSKYLPLQLRPWVRDHGLLATEDYRRLLASCHVAYVPVTYPENNPLRFSMPSRIPDYLISGLPVIACTEKNTGIHEFFQSTPLESTRLVWTGDEFLAALDHFAGDSQRWEKASGIATAYSKLAFAVEPARQLLFQRLNAVGLTPKSST